MNNPVDHYLVLGISPTTSHYELYAAYCDAVRRWLQDDLTFNHDTMDRLQNSYRVLQDPIQRAAFHNLEYGKHLPYGDQVEKRHSVRTMPIKKNVSKPKWKKIIINSQDQPQTYMNKTQGHGYVQETQSECYAYKQEFQPECYENQGEPQREYQQESQPESFEYQQESQPESYELQQELNPECYAFQPKCYEYQQKSQPESYGYLQESQYYQNQPNTYEYMQKPQNQYYGMLQVPQPVYYGYQAHCY